MPKWELGTCKAYQSLLVAHHKKYMFEITVKSVWLTLPPSAYKEHSFSSTLSVILSFAPRSSESSLLLVASSPRPSVEIGLSQCSIPLLSSHLHHFQSPSPPAYDPLDHCLTIDCQVNVREATASCLKLYSPFSCPVSKLELKHHVFAHLHFILFHIISFHFYDWKILKTT